MSVDKNYVDTHDQKAALLCLCHLLGFDLFTRLQPMSRQKVQNRTRTNDEFTNPHPNPDAAHSGN